MREIIEDCVSQKSNFAIQFELGEYNLMKHVTCSHLVYVLLAILFSVYLYYHIREIIIGFVSRNL